MIQGFKIKLLKAIFNTQKIILFLSFKYFSFYKFFGKEIKTVKWVVGVDEIASMNKNISMSIDGAYSVNMSKNMYYDYHYDFALNSKGIIGILFRLIISPIIFGRLMNQTDGFLYVWSTRFLLSRFDQGEYEYKFIKKHGKKIIFYFLGNDIRSAQRSILLARKNGYECTSDYRKLINPEVMSNDREQMLKERCRIAERYGDLIFTASVDQASYFKKKTYPFGYFYPSHLIKKTSSKFEKIKMVKIVHAPTSPFTKGTAHVRSALIRLKKEGHDFDYIELIGAKNSEVLHHLRDTHIVMNEFYAAVPGTFGVEAMANYCALITSADETIEPDLPRGSNNAWFVTKSYEVYDNLKTLLEKPDLMKRYAESGYSWVIQNASDIVCSQKLQSQLDAIIKGEK